MILTAKQLEIKGWDLTVPAHLLDIPGLPAPAVRLRALRFVVPEAVKVVILGQDPYHTPGKANGLAFGIHPTFTGEANYSSFGNIIAEVEKAGYKLDDYTLESWAQQGVLLLNTRLSVKEYSPMSHANIGWEAVVEAILRQVPSTAIGLLWGREARELGEKFLKGPLIKTSHPSKYSATATSRPFLGSDCFSCCNNLLKSAGILPIRWGVPLNSALPGDVNIDIKTPQGE